MLTLLWSRSDFWTWLFLDLLWPVYLTSALYLFYKYRLKKSPTKVDGFRVAFWSVLAIVGLLHLLFGGPRLVLSGHERSVNSLAFSPDGRLLASGANDEMIRIWDPVTGKNLETLAFIDPAPVSSLDFSPDGKVLALGTWNKVTLLNVIDGKQLATLGKDRERGGTVINAVLFLPDAKRLVAADMGSLRVWDIESKRVQAALLDETKDFFEAEAIATSHDGKILASGNNRGVITLWDMVKENRKVTFAAHGDKKVSALDFSPDDRMLATGGHDARTVLWQLTASSEPKEILALKADTGDINSLAFSPDGKLLATGAYHVRVWNVATGKLLFVIKGRRVKIGQVTFSPDSATLAAGSDDGIIELWNVKSQEKRLTLKVEDGFPVLALGFSPDGKILASGTRGGFVNVWDPVTGNKKYVFQSDGNKTSPNIGTNPDSRVEAVAFSPDGKTLAAGTSQIVNLWDTETWRLRRNFWLSGRNAIKSLIFFPTGTLFAANDGASGVWDVITGQRLLGMDKYLGSFAALSANGKLLAAVPSGIGGVNIWNTNSWQRLFLLRTGVRSKLYSLAFSPDGRMLAGGDAHNDLALWLTPGTQHVPNVLNKVGCGFKVVSLTFSPNSKWLAVVASGAPFPGLKRGCIKIFRIQGNKFSFMPWRAAFGGKGLAFSPDSKTLAAPSGGNTIKLWRVE